MGVVILASVCLVQHRFFNELSVNYEQLKGEHDVQYKSLTQLSAEYEQLKAKYETLVEGISPEPWNLTPENVAKLKDILGGEVPIAFRWTGLHGSLDATEGHYKGSYMIVNRSMTTIDP